MRTIKNEEGPKALFKNSHQVRHNGAPSPVSVYSVVAPCATRTCATGPKAGCDVDFSG